MSVVRVRTTRKSVRALGLMASASVMSIMMAGEAQAACTATPAQPLNSITTNNSQVDCSGITTGATILANADNVLVSIRLGGTQFNNGSIEINGAGGTVEVRTSASTTNMQVTLQGNAASLSLNDTLSNNFSAAISGADSELRIGSGAIATAAPGAINLSSPAGSGSSFGLSGQLYSTGNAGSNYLVRGGAGDQTFQLFGGSTLGVQADGLAIMGGAGDDIIVVEDGAFITGGTGNNILFNGGNDNDTLAIFGSGISTYNSINIENLTIDAGVGGFRGLNGTHADLTQIDLVQGTVNVLNFAALGVPTSTINIAAAANLSLSQTSLGSFNHTLTGAGGINLNSAGAAITFGGTSNAFTGTFTIGAGNTAILANGDALGSANFVNGGTVQFGGGLALDNDISGTGNVIKSGAGRSSLSGTNSYAGGTIVQGGALAVSSGSALGSGAVDVNAGATLDLDFAANGTLANDIIGMGMLLKSGSATVTLTGNNSHSGGTIISAGAIRVDDFARLGTGLTQSNSGTSLLLDYNGAGQLLQTVPFLTGAGNFIKEGSGDVVMDLSSNYSGGTIIRAGRIGLNSGDALGTGVIQIDSGAELGIGGIILNNDVTGSGLVRKTASNLAEIYGNNSGFTGTIHVDDGILYATNGSAFGAGTLAIGGGTTAQLDAQANSVVAADLAGAGTFEKLGSALATLAGNGAAFSGTLAINAGALQIEGGQNIGTANVIVGNSGTLRLDTAGSTTLANVISGGGNVVKTGSGTVFITGANTYSGGTDIQQGAIRVTDTNFLGTGAINVQSGAALDLSIAGQQTLSQAVSGAGILRKSDQGDLTLLSNGLSGGVDIIGGRVIVSTAAALGGGPVTSAADTQLVFNNSSTETMSNVISGAGSLTKDGGGLLVIQNANSYTGGTVVSAGRLGLNNGQGLGTGTVLVLQGAELSLGGVVVANNIDGAGRVIKTANNVGSLTGNNSYSGGTDIQQGTLQINGPAALGTGDVTIGTGSILGINYAGTANAALSNALTGAGGLVKDGSGTVVINNGSNSFTGGTTINAGRIGLNFGNGLGSGAVVIAAGASLGLGDVTYANATSGAGQIVKTSSGLTTLTGTNTHSGGVAVQAGTLAVSGTAPLGTGTVTVSSGAALEFSNAATATFSNGLAGAGIFNKLGVGDLGFANDFAIGSLNLTAGRTRVNVVGTANVTVGTSATLDGTGRIIGNLTNDGTVAPGNSIGTLTVQGNYTHNANSVLEIEFDAAGNIDLLDVSGNAVLNGGTLRLIAIGGAEGQGGTFLRTGGTLTGTFSTVETLGVQMPLAVTYQTNGALLAPSVLTARPSTFNAQSMAAADTVLGFIDSIGVGDLRHGAGNRLWIEGFGAWGKRSASGTTLGYDHDTRGLAGGVTVDAGDAVSLGAAFGWAKGDIDLASNGGGGEQSSILGSVHARYTGTGFAVGGGVLYGRIDQDTLRNVSFDGFADSVEGSTDSNVFGAFAEIGLPLGSNGGWVFNANARGSFVRQSQDAYSESGASPLRIAVGEVNTRTLEGQAGLTAKTSLWNKGNGGEESPEALDLRIDVGGRYLGTLGNREIPVTFAASNASILLQGDKRDSVHGLFGLAIDYVIRSGATFSAGYRGEIGKTDRHTVHAGVSIAF